MNRLTLFLSCLLFTGCNGVFDYHPYDVRLDGEKDINLHNVERIEETCRDKDSLTVAFISDSHGWYSETEDMVADINGRKDVDFVIHGGDLTDCGTTKEYTWQRKRLSRLNVPYVALIGNHDFLGTGNETYSVMYGPMDFSFIAGRIKFVCLNTNATEYDYLAAVPNLDYMEEQRTADSTLFDRTIVCMHARPYSEQFNNNVAKAFEFYVRSFPGLLFCLNGHDHCLQEADLYGDGVMYYGAPSANRRIYLLFKIKKDGYTYEIINF